MTREEMLACLTDRPCDVCKFRKESGCERWSCVFEEEPDDAENEGDGTSEEESKDQLVELYCTDCPYFQFTGEPSADWYGTRCNKDNHEASPSMYSIQSLHDNCPLNRGVSE